MHLTATPSREVAQMLVSTTSKRGLNKEAWAALLKSKDWAWMPWGQSEGANVRQQPKSWDSQREGEKNKARERENFASKSSNLRHCWTAHRTKDWLNTRGELASSGLAHPLPKAGRRAGDRARRQGASSTKLRAGSYWSLMDQNLVVRSRQ